MSLIIRNLSDQLVDLVRDRILSGAVSSDHAIRQDALAAELGVSKIPLREALARLEEEGLVRSQANRGFFVRPLSAEEAREVYELRIKLEPEATALAVGRMSDADLGQLRELVDEAAALVKAATDYHEQLMANDRAFHNLITSRCGNPVLAALVENTSGHTVRARLWRGRLDPSADERTVGEHRLIYQAIVDGDGERARLRAAAHILGVEDALRAMATPDADS